jgi:Asp-tRNA(Asn)/Glu-tRNA(Gln) amidotransferase B subunit
MKIKDYIKSQLTLEKQPDLKLIYEELLNFGYKPEEIYKTINEVIAENIKQALENYRRKKNENK